MNPKEYLSQYQESLLRIQSLNEHLANLQAECESLRNARGERIRLDSAVANLVDTEKQIEQQTEIMKDLQQEVSRVILMIQNCNHRLLLTMVYVQGKTLVDAAVTMNYSYRQAKRMHRAALHDVAGILAQDAHASRSGAV